MVIPVGQSDNIQNLIKIAKTDGGYDYQDLQTVDLFHWLRVQKKSNKNCSERRSRSFLMQHVSSNKTY